jgi:hypothetical protein
MAVALAVPLIPVPQPQDKHLCTAWDSLVGLALKGVPQVFMALPGVVLLALVLGATETEPRPQEREQTGIKVRLLEPQPITVVAVVVAVVRRVATLGLLALAVLVAAPLETLRGVVQTLLRTLVAGAVGVETGGIWALLAAQAS